MTYVITYRHKGETHVRTAEASSAAAALKFHDHLATSEADILSTEQDGETRTVGELKNVAGQEASSGP